MKIKFASRWFLDTSQYRVLDLFPCQSVVLNDCPAADIFTWSEPALSLQATSGNRTVPSPPTDRKPLSTETSSPPPPLPTKPHPNLTTTKPRPTQPPPDAKTSHRDDRYRTDLLFRHSSHKWRLKVRIYLIYKSRKSVLQWDCNSQAKKFVAKNRIEAPPPPPDAGEDRLPVQ